MTRITEATIDDLDAVAPLFDAYRQFYEQHADLDRARTFLRERIDRGESTILLARRDGEAAGFAQLYPCFTSVGTARVWILNDLFVLRDHRRSGVGDALMHASIDFARSRGARRLQLETAEDNHAARPLYEKLGFAAEVGFVHYALEL